MVLRDGWRWILPLVVLASSVPGAPVAPAAEDAAAKGLEIALEMDRRDTGFDDSAAALEMILTDRQGDSSRRALRITTLEETGRDQGDKSIVVFDHPRDIKGTALLSYTHILEPDDQWLYLPALERVKRISSANKSGPFVGSEFAYEDLLAQEVDKYRYRWLRDEPCPGEAGEGLTCFVVERIPQYGNSGYTRQLVWVDQEQYRVIRVDYYDRKDALLKTLEMRDYRQYLGRYWRATEMVMTNRQNGKSTTLTFDDYDFKQGVSEATFKPARLSRIR
jgi:outer membrane lipoprotein-sorting protein